MNFKLEFGDLKVEINVESYVILSGIILYLIVKEWKYIFEKYKESTDNVKSNPLEEIQHLEKESLEFYQEDKTVLLEDETTSLDDTILITTESIENNLEESFSEEIIDTDEITNNLSQTAPSHELERENLLTGLSEERINSPTNNKPKKRRRRKPKKKKIDNDNYTLFIQPKVYEGKTIVEMWKENEQGESKEFTSEITSGLDLTIDKYAREAQYILSVLNMFEYLSNVNLEKFVLVIDEKNFKYMLSEFECYFRKKLDLQEFDFKILDEKEFYFRKKNSIMSGSI